MGHARHAMGRHIESWRSPPGVASEDETKRKLARGAAQTRARRPSFPAVVGAATWKRLTRRGSRNVIARWQRQKPALSTSGRRTPSSPATRPSLRATGAAPDAHASEPPSARNGLTPIRTTKMGAGNFLVGSGNPVASEIRDRMGMELAISTEHSTFFTENKIAIRAEKRVALVVYRPASFIFGSFTTSP